MQRIALCAILISKGEIMSKIQCQKIVAAIGGILHDDGCSIRLEAPKGKSIDGDVHEFVYSYDDKSEKKQAWEYMLEDLSYVKDQGGYVPCDNKVQDDECDWCDGEDAGLQGCECEQCDGK